MTLSARNRPEITCTLRRIPKADVMAAPDLEQTGSLVTRSRITLGSGALAAHTPDDVASVTAARWLTSGAKRWPPSAPQPVSAHAEPDATSIIQ